MPAPTRPARPKQRIDYPRPPVTVLHSELFREAEYEDGELYAQDDGDEEDLES